MSKVPKSMADTVDMPNLPVERQGSEVAAFIPRAAEGEDTGTEAMADEGLVLPRLKVIQGMTADKPEGAPDGSFFNSVTKDVLGKEIVFVPIYYWTSRIYFEKGTMKVLCRSFKSIKPDVGCLAQTCAVCPHSKWGDNNEKPACQFTYNYALVTESQIDAFLKGGFDIPMILLGHGANVPAFKKMNSIIKAKALSANRTPMYGMKFKAKTRAEKFDVGSAHVIDFEFVGYVNEQEFNVTKKLYGTMKEQDSKGISDSETATAQTQPEPL